MVSMRTGVLWKTKRVSRPTGAIVLRLQSRDVHAKSRGHMVARLAHHTAAIRTLMFVETGAMWSSKLAKERLTAIAAQRLPRLLP